MRRDDLKAFVTAATVLVALTAAAAQATAQSQLTGCLGSGPLTNVAVGTAPTKPCAQNDIQVTFGGTPPAPVTGGFTDGTDVSIPLLGPPTMVASGELVLPGSYVVLALAEVHNTSLIGEHLAARCHVLKDVNGTPVETVDLSPLSDLVSGERVTYNLQGAATAAADETTTLTLVCRSDRGPGELLKARLAAIRIQ